MSLEDISVIVPTLNCRRLLELNDKDFRTTLADVGEVIVVDSYSTDGTVEYIREIIDHPKVSYYSHVKGLYACWNYGIMKATKPWIYIATAGDVIARQDLMYLHQIATTQSVDVVCAPPTFKNEFGEPCDDLPWPIFSLLDEYEEEDVVLLSRIDLAAFALHHGRPRRGSQGWLGSSASNLYRTKVLQERPFPTQVGKSGDTLWGIENSLEVKAAFCRKSCGQFIIHGNHEEGLSEEELSGKGYHGLACDQTLDAILKSSALDNLSDELKGFIKDLFIAECEGTMDLIRRRKEIVARKERYLLLRERSERLRVALEQTRARVVKLKALNQRLRNALGRQSRKA